MMMRVGFGCDIHPFDPQKPLYLGGIFFPDEPGLKGHSDADVILHALCDALLGAAALGDIGRLFPDTDDRYKDRRSTFFLEEVMKLLHEHDYEIGNIDLMVLAERPKLSPKKDEICTHIASVCNITVEQVSVKASTSEKMGFVGREEGIVAYAVAVITKNRGIT